MLPLLRHCPGRLSLAGYGDAPCRRGAMDDANADAETLGALVDAIKVKQGAHLMRGAWQARVVSFALLPGSVPGPPW